MIHGLQGWLLTRYEDVKRALNDASLSNDRRAANPSARSASWLFADEPFNLQHHMLRSDPPRHTRIRKAVSPAFSARQAERLRPRIELIANELIDRFAGLGHTELISSYAFPLPLLVIMEILGIPAHDRAQLHTWSDTLSSGSAASEADIAATLTSMRAYFQDAAKEGRYGAGRDSLLDVLAISYRDHVIDEAEFLSSGFQLLQGGHVTTLGMIANSMLALLSHRDQMAALRRNPGIARSSIEELLRFDPPMEIATIRFTTRPVQFGGVTIPGDGQPVLLALAAANRDPARFADPDELDLLRDSSGQLAFAYGPHYCLGAHLARVEAAVGILALIDRLDDMVLAVGADELRWRPNPHLRRPEQLPITFSARDPSTLPASE